MAYSAFPPRKVGQLPVHTYEEELAEWRIRMSASKRKGTAFETEVVNYLIHRGLTDAGRQILTGNVDLGDIRGIPGWVIECKNVNSANWAQFMDETDQERKNAGAQFGLLVVRRRMKTIDKAYAVLPLGQAVTLIGDDVESR